MGNLIACLGKSTLPDTYKQQILKNAEAEGATPHSAIDSVHRGLRAELDSMLSQIGHTHPVEPTVLPANVAAIAGATEAQVNQPGGRIDKMPGRALPTKINAQDTPTASAVSKALRYFAVDNQRYSGRYAGLPVVEASKLKLSAAEKEQVTKYGWDMRYKGSSDIKLNPEQKKLYQIFRDQYTETADMADNLGIKVQTGPGQFRERIRDPHYFASMLDPKIVNEMLTHPLSPESLAYKQQWAQHMVDVSHNTLPLDEAHRLIDQYNSALSSGVSDRSTFGAVNRAEGYGLPYDMTIKDPNILLERYGNKVAHDFALKKNVQDSPVVRRALNIPDREGNVGDVPFHPLPGELVEDARKIVLRQHTSRDLTYQMANRIVTAAWMGPLTAAKDAVSNIGLLGQLDMSQWLSVGKGLAAMDRSAYESGIREGIIKRNPVHTRDMVMMHETAIDSMRGILNAYGKVTGRHYMDVALRTSNMAIGRTVAMDAFRKAAVGHRPSIEFLAKYGELRNIPWKEHFGKPLSEIPKEIFEQYGAALNDRIQGTYDLRGVPIGATEGILSPFFALSRWSLERTNNFIDDAYKPAFMPVPGQARDFKPLLKMMPIAVGTGYATQQLLENIFGVESPLTSAKEMQATNTEVEESAKNLIMLSAMGSVFGILGDWSRAGLDLSQGNLPRGNSFPLVASIGELAQKATQTAEAYHNGEPAGKLAFNVFAKILEDNTQVARMAVKLYDSHTDPTKVDEKNDMRNYYKWQDLALDKTKGWYGQQGNPFMGLLAKQFKDAKTLTEAQAMVPEIASYARDKSKGDAEYQWKILDGLKQNPQQTAPGDSSPMQQQQFMDFLERTQPAEKVQAFKQRHFDKADAQYYKNAILDVELDRLVAQGMLLPRPAIVQPKVLRPLIQKPLLQRSP
jgi:hypothetical protein